MCKGYHQEVAHTRWAIKAININQPEKWKVALIGRRIWDDLSVSQIGGPENNGVFSGFHRTLEAVDRSKKHWLCVSKATVISAPPVFYQGSRLDLTIILGYFLGRHQFLPISKPRWSVSSPRFLLVKSALDEGTREHPDQHGKKNAKTKKQRLVSARCFPSMGRTSKTPWVFHEFFPLRPEFPHGFFPPKKQPGNGRGTALPLSPQCWQCHHHQGTQTENPGSSHNHLNQVEKWWSTIIILG